jgi:creatinine amidohydrolase/Fe(II)-dependent formamide hydrolase-like protein
MFYMQSKEYEEAAHVLFPEMENMWGHADEIETSLYMGIKPELVQLEKAQDNPITDTMMLGSAVLPLRLIWSSFSKEGIYGNVKNSSAEKGRQLVDAAVSGLAKIYTQFYEKKIPVAVDHH